MKDKLHARAAVLFFLGMVTGLWAAVVLTHGAALGGMIELHPQHERLALGAHLNGLLGCFWLLAVAYTGANERVAKLTTVAAYGNWFVTVVASVLDVRGLDFQPPFSNQAIAGLLQVFVVIPTLMASGLWAYGMVMSARRSKA